MTETDDIKARLRANLAGVQIDAMHGDNLAITLCAAFDDPDEEVDDEMGWGSSAVSMCTATLDAIHAHYAVHIARLEERCAALTGQVETGAAEIERQRELFRLDGEGHASYVRDLTNKHEVRITKYAERIGEMMCERDAARREIRQLEEFIGRREDDILHIARENASLREEVGRLREALHDIAEHPEKSSCRTGSYAVGWAFFNVQGIARTALKNQEPKP